MTNDPRVEPACQAYMLAVGICMSPRDWPTGDVGIDHDHREAMKAALAAADAAAPSSILWAVHSIGPDEIWAMPDYDTAVRNAWGMCRWSKLERRNPDQPEIFFTPCTWLGSAEEHAANLQEQGGVEKVRETTANHFNRVMQQREQALTAAPSPWRPIAEAPRNGDWFVALPRDENDPPELICLDSSDSPAKFVNTRGDNVRTELYEWFMTLSFFLEKEGKWRPIAEAPRDGTHILAYEGTGAMYRAAFNADGYWESYCGQYVVEAPEPELFILLSALPPLPEKEESDGK